MTAPFPALPEFPNPPPLPAPREAAETLTDFLMDLFEAGVASVVDPLPLAPGQGWREWAQSVLRPPASTAAPTPAAPSTVTSLEAKAGATTVTNLKADAPPAVAVVKKHRPPILPLLEAAHRRLLLELPTAPRSAEPLVFDPLIAVEGARRLYQFCQLLAAPQQEKEALRHSLSPEFRPRNFAGLLSVFSTWRYLPMTWEHVRQRLTVSSGGTPAMQEAERLLREQLAVWPLPLAAVLAMPFTPEPASLAMLDSHPVGARFLAEQLLDRALSNTDITVEAWATDRALTVMTGLLANVPVEPGRARLHRALGARGDGLIAAWDALVERGLSGE